MNRMRLENESRFLERVTLYRLEYHSDRSAAIAVERERRHENGEAYIAGCWLLRQEAERVARGLQRKERFIFFEIVVLLAVLLGIAQGLWSLFAFLLLP